jgi:hypothetical protein
MSDYSLSPTIAILMTEIIGTWILALIVGKMWLNIWKEKQKPNWVLFVPPICWQVILAIVYVNDYALVWIYQFNKGATLPYGVLWFILNPFWNTINTYLWYLLAWSMAFLGIMYFLVKHDKLNVEYVYWTQITNIIFVIAHNPQSITVLSFIYLIPVFGLPALGLAAIIKLPIGWSFPPTDSHWTCAFGGSHIVVSPEQYGIPCNHFSLQLAYWIQYPSLVFNYIMYAIIAFWIVKTLYAYTNPRAVIARILLKLRLFYLFRIILLERLGLFERKVVQCIKNSKGYMFVDVGSANGYFAKLARKTFQQVITIDPNPKWQSNYQYALSDKNGRGMYFPINYDKPRLTNTLRFDSLIHHADLVKIDVEGAEFEVIKGMSGAHVRNILVELHDESRDLELIALLGLQGFTCTRIDRNHFFARKHF